MVPAVRKSLTSTQNKVLHQLYFTSQCLHFVLTFQQNAYLLYTVCILYWKYFNHGSDSFRHILFSLDSKCVNSQIFKLWTSSAQKAEFCLKCFRSSKVNFIYIICLRALEKRLSSRQTLLKNESFPEAAKSAGYYMSGTLSPCLPFCSSNFKWIIAGQ